MVSNLQFTNDIIKTVMYCLLKLPKINTVINSRFSDFNVYFFIYEEVNTLTF